MKLYEGKFVRYVRGDKKVKKAELKEVILLSLELINGKKIFPNFIGDVFMGESVGYIYELEFTTKNDLIEGVDDGVLIVPEDEDYWVYTKPIYPEEVQEIVVHKKFKVEEDIYRVYRINFLFYAAYFFNWTQSEIDYVLAYKWDLNIKGKELFKKLLMKNKKVTDSIKLWTVVN